MTLSITKVNNKILPSLMGVTILVRNDCNQVLARSSLFRKSKAEVGVCFVDIFIVVGKNE